MIEQILEDFARGLGDWTYLLVGVLAFLETGAFVGLVAPGEFAVILGGVVAGQGEISVLLLIGIVWFAAWAGDSVSFLLGARLGRGFVIRHGPRFRLTPDRFAGVESYFARHGGKTILVGRFIGLVRALAPFIAGSSRMRYRAFVPYCILGTGLWSSAFVLLGYLFSRSLDRVAELAGKGTFAFGVVVFAVAGAVLAVRFLRRPRNRARLAAFFDRTPVLRYLPPLVRPLWRVAGPRLRFLLGRLTPGGLGLELSAVLAALAVGIYVLVLYLSLLGGDPGPTAGDRVAFDVTREVTAAWLSEVARSFTRLGAAYVAWPLAALACLLLAVRRRWLELAVLAAGLAIAVAGVAVLKDAVARPRPPGPLVAADGSSFPSGHAAYSTLYPVLAIVAARVAPAIAARLALTVAGIAAAAAIGLSRVYLRVHYLSDVLGGWATATAAFALCAAVALVVGHLRQNGRRDAGRPQDPGRDRDPRPQPL